MNLSTLDIGLATPGGKDASPLATATATAADPSAPPAAFGQLMAQALQQIAPPGQPAAAGLGKTEDEPGQDLASTGTEEADSATPIDPALLSPWMVIPAVQQVSVGPHLQAITSSTAPPDSASLAAFAKAQGLDARAIAWLLDPSAAASAATASPATGTGTATLPQLAATALTATPPAGWVPPALGMWAANAPSTLASGTGASATPAETSASTELDPEAVTLAGLRWVPPTLIAAGATGTTRAPASWTFAPAPPTNWSESELNLSSLPGLEDEASTPSTATDTTAPALTDTPLPARETPTVARQTPAATATPTAESPVAQKNASDQMQQLADQMADAIGERMIREIERGHWNMRLMLKPAHLGHIEVEMRLRAGELDASFAAPQAATRELLQDGLARLKDSLNQMGMDVANLDVKTGQNRQNGGEPTPGQRQIVKNPSNSDTPDTPTAAALPATRPRRPDGWDVMV